MHKVAARVVFGTVMIAVIVGILLLDHGLAKGAPRWTGVPVAVVLAVLAGAGVLELGKMAAVNSGVRVLSISGVLSAVALATLPCWWYFLRGAVDLPGFPEVLCLGGLAVAGVFLEQMVRYRVDGALRNVSGTILGIFYLGFGCAIILWLRYFDLRAMILYLAVVKFTDIGAYAVGSAFGRHKLIPWLSPGKSWEGLAGGVAVAAGMGALVVAVLGVPGLDLWEGAVFGAAMALAGQFADLCESLLKRSMQVKDSASLIPQFGGVLDLMDSPLLAGPFALMALAVLA